MDRKVLIKNCGVSKKKIITEQDWELFRYQYSFTIITFTNNKYNF